MSWNDNTGTLRSVSQLALPLSGCSDGQDVNARVYDLLAAHPQLFQLDMSEWQTPEPFDCKFVSDDLLSMRRLSLAGRPVATDVFAYWLKRVDGVVQLTAVNGTYLPKVDAAMADTMAACNSLTAPAAKTTARATPLQAAVFSQCQRTGTVSYRPRANDTFDFAPAETWLWQEASGQSLLTGERTLRVIVNPANYTRELRSSAARCPTGSGNGFTIGFDVTFDVQTGAIVNVKPGLDCVVC